MNRHRRLAYSIALWLVYLAAGVFCLSAILTVVDMVIEEMAR